MTRYINLENYTDEYESLDKTIASDIPDTYEYAIVIEKYTYPKDAKTNTKYTLDVRRPRYSIGSTQEINYELKIYKPNKDIITIRQKVFAAFHMGYHEWISNYYVAINGESVILSDGGIPYKLNRILKKALKGLDKYTATSKKNKKISRYLKEKALKKMEKLKEKKRKQNQKATISTMAKLFRRWEE